MMAILDKLMEKKELIIYIKARKAEIARTAHEQIPKLPSKERENFRLQMRARIKELDYLNHVMAHDSLKSISLENWAKNWKAIKEFEQGRKIPEKKDE
jgi:ribosomal protein S30